MTDLTFPRLIDDVVVPFEDDKPFFVDEAPIERKTIRRLKILRQREVFLTAFADLHWGLRQADTQLQKLYAEQYHVRFEAAEVARIIGSVKINSKWDE